MFLSAQSLSHNKYYFLNLYEFFKRWIDVLVTKLKDRLFGGFRPPCLCHSKETRHQHGVSIQSFIDLGKTNILRLKNPRWGFSYIYLLSFPRFQTLCIEQFWFLLLMAWQWKPPTAPILKTRRPQKKRVTWLLALAHKAFRHMRLCGVFWLSQWRVRLSFPRYKGYMSSTDLKNSPRAFA